MRAIGSAELLDIWERGQHAPPLERALLLLAAVYKVDTAAVAALSIGDRDARLLLFRERIFGSRLVNTASCPHCGGKTEWEMRCSELRLQQIALEAPSWQDWRHEGYHVSYRLPSSADIRTVQRQAEPVNPAQFLKSCIRSAAFENEPQDVNALPGTLLDALAGRMSEQDPQADIRMELACPDCGHAWSAAFDIMRYLWTEIDNWSRRLIAEIALLARAFGWSEPEILRLSPVRRRRYLELVTPR